MTNTVVQACQWIGCQRGMHGATSVVGSTHQTASSPTADVAPHPRPSVAMSQLTMHFYLTKMITKHSCVGLLEQLLTCVGGRYHPQGTFCTSALPDLGTPLYSPNLRHNHVIVIK